MSATSRYALLTFDLDGTLAETAGEIAEAANRTFAELGLPKRTVEAVSRRIGAGTRELMLALLRDISDEGNAAASKADRDEVLRRFAVHYEATAGTSCRPYPGVVAALARLRRAGLRLACVTNKEARYSERVLAACGIGADFDLLIGGDTLAVKKPDARVIGHAMEVLGAAPERTAHIGDSRTDVEAARNAGVAAWVVPYGYNAGVPIEEARPDRIFANLESVADFVLS